MAEFQTFKTPSVEERRGGFFEGFFEESKLGKPTKCCLCAFCWSASRLKSPPVKCWIRSTDSVPAFLFWSLKHRNWRSDSIRESLCATQPSPVNCSLLTSELLLNCSPVNSSPVIYSGLLRSTAQLFRVNCSPLNSILRQQPWLTLN